MIGDIMAVNRLRMGTDGRGVTTLVAFFDCPLHCKYCINDYCHERGYFLESVPRAAYTPEELIKVLEKDAIYYRMSGGGVTFGGGEPLMQSAFIHEVCRLADPSWKKRIETSLSVPWRDVEPVVDDIDEWIIDIKSMNADIYTEYTGSTIHRMQENLWWLKNSVDQSILRIRIPRIPRFADEKSVRESVNLLRERYDLEAEVFDYMMTSPVSRKIYDDDEDDDFDTWKFRL